jgi:hypothetical protein
MLTLSVEKLTALDVEKLNALHVAPRKTPRKLEFLFWD